MRLLVVSRPFVFHGGVERATAGFLEALVAHGHDVHLLSPPGQQPLPGVTLRTLALPPVPAAARVLVLPLAVRLAVRRRRWDAVQSHERTLGQDVYRAGEGCHRAYLDALAPPIRRRAAYHRLLLALERRVFATTPEIVAISRLGAREIARLYGVPEARLTVVYNGVDLDRFHPDNRARHRAAARAEAGVPAGAWAALFAGSGFERKGLDTAIEALAALEDRAGRLLVLGKGRPGPYRDLAARLGLADRVVWLGARPDIERWYAAADVLVLPTRYEPFGNVHLEALASGLPVVTTTAAGGAEVIGPESGAVVGPGDARALADALVQLRGGDPGRLAAAARADAEPFTHARQVADFERIYRRLPAARPAFTLRNR
ncbi:MAG TPA: glycosyltransferase family 4 protein [Methylomirabilota bacterium]|nr:glycosyltransferase family 4 protein [Methylomirabilota bacterium]